MTFFVSVFCAAVCLTGAQQQFTYENNGAENWPLEFPTCGGDRQSPIDVNRVTPADLGPFQFHNYHLPADITVTNMGHTAQATLNMGTPPTLTGGGLRAKYVLDQLHFHSGSEHTYEGTRYPMEMHMVHHNIKFRNFTEAVASGEEDAVAVLAFFFEVTHHPNLAWDNLVRALAHVKEPETSQQVFPPTPLCLWLPQDLSRFYRYYGSLTTPTCDQVVVWTLFSNDIPISHHQIATIGAAKVTSLFFLTNQFVVQLQLEQWRHLKTPTGNKQTNTFRPAQLRNGREILFNQGWWS
ncbi:unnamed protein product [Darwinula stevensoni]|uniref:carbonic anhydrase n=1 Tax=Darwinula stevensoni TaxID=69355 RepID=A0A7R8X9A9_9CRUS|nr:unnamed protein product [Darwinula stevensoni]CAG0889490.1 unnamed protein product [Darwinula stevensoni]